MPWRSTWIIFTTFCNSIFPRISPAWATGNLYLICYMKLTANATGSPILLPNLPLKKSPARQTTWCWGRWIKSSYSVHTLCCDHKQFWIRWRNLSWCFAQRIIAPVMHMHHGRQQVCPKPYMPIVYLVSTCDTISTISCPYSVICASSKHLNAFNSSSVVGANFAILSQEAFLNTSYALILFNLYFFVR